MHALDGTNLDLNSYRAVVFDGAHCALGAAARPRVEAARQTVLDTLEKDMAVYGVNTRP